MNQEEKYREEFEGLTKRETVLIDNFNKESKYYFLDTQAEWEGFLTARKIAQEEIDHCKAYYNKDNKIGPIAQLEYAIEKLETLRKERDELKKWLSEAVPWVKVANKYYYIGRGDLNNWLERLKTKVKKYKVLYRFHNSLMVSNDYFKNTDDFLKYVGIPALQLLESTEKEFEE